MPDNTYDSDLTPMGIAGSADSEKANDADLTPAGVTAGSFNIIANPMFPQLTAPGVDWQPIIVAAADPQTTMDWMYHKI